MPPKRKRNSKKDTKSLPSGSHVEDPNQNKKDDVNHNSSTNITATVPNENMLFHLLNRLNEISQSRSRCSDAIQTIPSASFRPSFLGAIDGDAHTDAHMLVIGIYTTNLLLSAPKKKVVSDTVEKAKAFVLAFLASRTSLILLQDKTQLERTCNTSLSAFSTTNDAMVILGKALISTICASIASFQLLVSSQTKDVEKDSKLMAWAMWTNINTLERLLNITKKRVTPSIEMDPDSSTQPKVYTLPLTAKRHTIWSSICDGMDLDETNALLTNTSSKMKKKTLDSLSSHAFDPSELLEYCKLLESSSCISDEHLIFLATYLDPKSDDVAPPPTKRKRKVVEAKDIGPVEELSGIIQGHFFGVRMVLTKFVSTALVNSCNGQFLLLEATEQMLKNGDYWANILQTESISVDEEELKSGKKKGKKKKKTVQMKPSRNLCLNVFASRVIDLVHDAGKHGNRDGTSEVDTYASSIWKSNQCQQIDGKRDICNISILLMKSMLNVHKKCLTDIALAAVNDLDTFDAHVSKTKDHNTIYLLVNQEEKQAPFSTNELAMLHPMISKSFETLIKAITKQIGVEEAKESRIITGIVASFGIKTCAVKVGMDDLQNQSKKLIVSKVVVCDAKLASFVVSQVGEAIRGLFNFTQNTPKGYNSELSAEFSPAMLQTFLLDQPLVLDDSKDHAGLLSNSDPTVYQFNIHEDEVVNDGYILGLFLRAFLPTSGKVSKTEVSKAPEELMTAVLDIVLCCVHFNEIAVRSDDQNAANSRDIFTKTTLAADCMDAICRCITFISLGSETVDNITSAEVRLAIQLRGVLRDYLRPFVLIPSIIEVGVNIEDLFLNSKRAYSTICNTHGETSKQHSVPHSNFSEWEKRLWTSHIRCCLAFGRGNAKPTYYSDRPYLKRKFWIGNPTEKMHLLEEIFSDLNYDTLLYFPTSVHAILAASVASDPIPKSSKDAGPEKLLCNKVFKSIITSLNDPDIAILPQNSHISPGNVPLPRRDAQLIAISLGRIPLKDQQKIISRFIREFESAVIKIKDTDRLRNLIYTDKRYASFLAKTITLCSHIIDMVCIGKSLTDLFSDCVNGLYYDIDYFTKPIPRMGDDDFSDICEDQSYVGLWRESFKSDLPPMNSDLFFNDPLSSRDIVSYTSILDISLGLGFESARSDKCYLLFSAWNAGTKAIPYAPDEWFNTLTTTGWSNNGHGKQLRAMREAMCNIYETLETGEYTPDSLLSSLLKRKRMTSLGSNERDTGVALLKSSVKTSVEILNTITVESNDSLQFSSGDSVVIEATLNFISFLAAMFTKHETDYLSLMVKYHKRKRKTSSFSGESLGEDDQGSDECSNDSDDDGYHDFDEDEEDDDATIEGFRKLEDICRNLGASPLHPDWLDSTCHLRSNITVIECIQLAESMLSSLTKFGTMIFEKFDAQLKDALFAHTTACVTDEQICNSAIEVVRSIRFSDKTSNIWKKELASVFHLDESFVDAMCNDFLCKNAKFAKETFAVHASSRIRGGFCELFCNGEEWLPSQAGYRSADEWELLFSDSFVGACADLHLSAPQKSNAVKFADLVQTRRLLQSTVSAIVTVNALLRFGISGSMGPSQLSSMFASENNGSKVGKSNIISPHHTSDIKHYVNEKSLAPEEKKQTVISINSAICFLARIQAHGYHDQLRRSARAALCHLVSQDTDVLNLETPYVLHTAIGAMRRLLQVDENSVQLFDKIVESFRFYGETENDFDKVLLFTLGYRVPIRICSVADRYVDAWTLLRSNDLNAKYWDGALSEDITFFCDVLLGDSHIVSGTRLKLLKALRGALSAEDISSISNGLTANILNQLTARGDVALTLLVQNDICNGVDHGIAFETSKVLCAIMMLLLRPLKDLIQPPKLEFFRSTLVCLRQNMKLWIGQSSQQHVLCLATYLAIRLGIVKEICDELVSLTREKSDMQYLDSVEIFCRIINDFHKILVEGNSEDQIFSNAGLLSEANGVEKDSPQIIPNCCTYTSTAGDFTDQHWYNCYTCGLVYDKGCCSLCAQICHRGHDVGYSRKSSFFCDCGAEVRTSSGRLKCRCLYPLSQASLSSLRSKSINTQSSVELTHSTENYWQDAFTLAKVYFQDIAKSAVANFIQTIDSTLIEQLFHLFNQCFDSCLNRESFQKSIKDILKPSEPVIPAHQEELRMALRSFKDFNLSSFDKAGVMKPLLSSKRHIVSVSLNTDLSIDRSKKLLLAKDAVIRNAVVTDSRGRMVIAESKTLLFCSSSSLVNTRHFENANENMFERTQLSIVGQKSVDFSILGMAECPGRNRQLVVWGFSTAAVYIVNSGFDSIEFTIQLNTNIGKDACDSEYIVKAEWLTENIIVLFCATCVHFYEIEKYCVAQNDETYSCSPSLSYVLGSDDTIIRSGVIISSNCNNEVKSSAASSCAQSKRKIMTLYDDGRMRVIDFGLDMNGALETKGELIIDQDKVLSFPLPRKSHQDSMSFDFEDSNAKTLGEGSSLDFLPQSGLLLYKCSTSDLIAFTLDDNCEITGSFEFLPCMISCDVIGDPTMGSVYGPYTNFCEIGINEGNLLPSYRLAFTAKSVRTNAPQLMYMEFNRHHSKVERLSSKSDLNQIMSSTLRFEGIAAISAPKIIEDLTVKGPRHPNATFIEQVYLISVMSNGCISLYTDNPFIDSNMHGVHSDSQGSLSSRCDDPEDKVRFSDSVVKDAEMKIYPLDYFEKLMNITNEECIVLGGEGFSEDKATMKRKLCTGSQEYVVCSSRGGCTLNISLQRNTAKGIRKSDGFDPSTHAIVAVRFLLGTSQTDYFPEEVSVLGRQLKVHRQKKRWYDVPLTEEEIILVVRSGVVSITLLGSTDSERLYPTIDSVEVYADKRVNLGHLFPIHMVPIRCSQMYACRGFDMKDENMTRTALNTYVLTLSHMLQMMNKNKSSLSAVTESSLQRLVEATTIASNTSDTVRENVMKLVLDMKRDTKASQQLLDKGTLRGICIVLRDLQDITETSEFRTLIKNDSLIADRICERILAKLNLCLSKATEIVKVHPGNYKNVLETLISSGNTHSSIALSTKAILNHCPNSKEIVRTMELLVELIIHEASWSHVTSSSSRHEFASLKDLSTILTCSDEFIAKQCCSKVAEVVKDLADRHVLSHQCDSCGICPISNTRYTMDEDGYDIDLCQTCYEAGSLYANHKSCDANLPVLIGSRHVYVSDIGKNLSCAEIKKMTAKIVPIHQSQTRTFEFEESSSTDSECDEDLQIALKMSMEGQDESRITYTPMQVQISSTLLDIIIQSFSEDCSMINTTAVINLLLNLVLNCKDDDIKKDICKNMCESLCKELADSCKLYVAQRVDTRQLLRLRLAIMAYTRTLICLLKGKDDVEGVFLSSDEYPSKPTSAKATAPTNNKGKTDPRFICNVHGIPAVRRRCSHGENKEKRFYVCGMERKQRCNYFKWADDVSSQVTTDTKGSSASAALQSKASNLMDSKVQSILWRQLNKGSPASHNQLCGLLIHFIRNSTGDVSKPECSDLEFEKAAVVVRHHLHSTLETSDDENDGINTAIQVLARETSNRPLSLREFQFPALMCSEQNVVEVCLHFLSCVARFVFASFSEWNVWYKPLSSIIGKNVSTSLSFEAKTLLKCICGGDKARYHQIRDSFVFASEFATILLFCETPFHAARDIVEKSRLCGPNWQDVVDFSWDKMSIGSLLGTHDLIPEDALLTENLEKLRTAVNHLVTVAKSRGDNWRHFCSLKVLPEIDTDETHSILDRIPSLSECSPITILFWLVCILPSDFLGDMLFLFDAALQRNVTEKNDINTVKMNDNKSMRMSVSSAVSSRNKKSLQSVSKDSESLDSPAMLLLSGRNKLSLSNIFSFVTIFILKGNSSEIRSHAVQVAYRLLTSFLLHYSPSSSELDAFLRKLMSICLKDAGILGISAVEFLKFTNTLFSNISVMNGMDKSFFFRASVICYVDQVAYDNSNSRSCRSISLAKSQAKKGPIDKLDLSRCRHCETRSTSHIDKPKTSKEIASKKRKSSDASEAEVTSSIPPKWTRSQLSDYHRVRLDMQQSVSTEFTSFLQLRSRYSISEVFLNVKDQRGRFVKSINLYFSPKPVGDVNTLAEIHYEPFWQPLGSITISKGASSASYKLKTPVVAANLKFEYLEFYDKITGQKTINGAVVLHCPRCTRIVNNAHGGVCGHCGEVAFQCRKCRHINYDQLDAFLCVECGYCSSGTFTWELNAGVASCAVAIEDENDLERSIIKLFANNKKIAEIREKLEVLKDNLEKRAPSASLGKKKLKCTHAAPLALALDNKLPRFLGSNRHEKAKSHDKETISDPSVNSRTQSLLNLARSLRGEGWNDLRSSLGDFIIQHTRLRGNFPFEDDDGVADEANGLSFSVSDPLTRLVARLEGSSRDVTSATPRSNVNLIPQRKEDEKGNKSDSILNLMDEAKQLHTQMLIMERECHELEARIAAWKNLNRDDIAPRGYISPSITYNPCTCSNCSPSITFHLLEIVHALLESDIQSADCILDTSFIHCLFDEQDIEKPNLKLLKRSVLVTIAKTSDKGSLLILDELRRRLAGARDTNSAEILGTLLESQVKNENKFADLAVQTLST